MSLFARHWARIAVTLIPLVFALPHASGALRIGVLHHLEDIIYDARLRATMPETLDERIVIVDIDEKAWLKGSLALGVQPARCAGGRTAAAPTGQAGWLGRGFR